jgi:prepilin-type processing-associated H-X9-DG protein
MSKQQSTAFTLIELTVVIFVVAALAATLVSGVARTQPNGKAVRCLNNLRQFAAAWTMYSADSAEKVANNYGVSQTLDAINFRAFDNWVNNVMTWGASSSVYDVSNTNVFWLTNGVLGKYLSSSPDVFKCPADTFLSTVQAAAGFKQRLRSISMNSVFGHFSPYGDPTWTGVNWAFPQYVQYLKQASVPKPAKTWLVIDEHPDSINDGYFVNSPSASNWQDIPSSLHSRGCGFGFVDGHTEMRKWRSVTSIHAVGFAYPLTRSFDTAGRADFSWYLEHTGYVNATTGQPQFNY